MPRMAAWVGVKAMMLLPTPKKMMNSQTIGGMPRTTSM